MSAASIISTDTTSQSTVIPDNVIVSMKRSLGELRETLGSFDEATVENIRRGGEQEIDNEIRRIQKKLDTSDKRQQAEIDEINQLVKQVFEEELVKTLEGLIQAGVLQDIDDLVKEQVRLQLPKYLSEDLQNEIKRHQEELLALEMELKNSESVRHNAALMMDPDLELRPLYLPDGSISPGFPRTLGELFNMTEEVAVVLLHHYGRHEAIAKNSREKNVNEVMRLCGVRYLLVRSPLSYGVGSIADCHVSAVASHVLLCTPLRYAGSLGQRGTRYALQPDVGY
ncbi:hypothetical protein C8Q77DRAFT_1076747 [Trametes polyzona]|nr:hypothetical protein C8Q77DRAFT_1076747 [Trametes polyzona]